ncbi:MAG: hypothetical protein WCO56_07590 [Verrucomicrobiota bacterium]
MAHTVKTKTDGRKPALPVRASLPTTAVRMNLLGVEYFHLKTEDGGDLFLTQYGCPFWEHLQPHNWYARDWFETKRERLLGTSTVYRLPTKEVGGVSLHLVVKWSRVGEVIPVDTLTMNKFIHAEFNSPFEEFSLLMELRKGEYGPPDIRIRTQKPLAIYVPSERLQFWQTGRSEDKMAAKLARSPGVELDILRQYVVIYGWVKGLDLVETADLFQLEGTARNQMLAGMTSLVIHELEQKGYRVVDMKPAHVIVRPQPDFSLMRDRHRQIVYALIDYELMLRTEEHEQAVRSANRQYYLSHMARRFEDNASNPLPSHLKAVNILGVDYIYGHAESTGGLMWVVGKDPELFNFFLPERWRRTPKNPLADHSQAAHTRTKDNVNLVWKISRLGLRPEVPDDSSNSRAILEHGFNNPFEAFSYAMEIARRGGRTTYPRAIYMTGHKTETQLVDLRHYTPLADLRTPDGHPVLRQDHDYITIWGWWNGPDQQLADHDTGHYRSLNLHQAQEMKLLSATEVVGLLEHARLRLARFGFEDLNLEPEHLLIAFDAKKQLVLDTFGKPELRLCNFELVRPLAADVPTA